MAPRCTDFERPSVLFIMNRKPRHNSKTEIHKAAVTLQNPKSSKLDKTLAAGILADIPRKKGGKAK
jgi:hypothetical protein